MSDRIVSDLARIMREHDHEAPPAAELLHGLREAPAPDRWPAWTRGRRRFTPLAAAAAVAAVIAGSVLAGAQLSGPGAVTSGRNGNGVPLGCPAQYARAAPWVPATASGVPTMARLAPRRTPISAVICGYDGMNIGAQAGWKLSGRRVLHGGLAGLAAELAWQPRKVAGQSIACSLVGGSQVNYLIGLTYHGGGRLWVAATQDPNDCVGSSNGEFTSFAVIGGLVAKSFKSGHWPARIPASCRAGGTGGRLGQDRVIVPAGATSLSICGDHGGPTLTTGYAGLATALNALPTRPSDRQCSMIPHDHGRLYTLVFGYPQGPAVQVIVNSGCDPAIDNGSLQSASARTIVPMIARLLR
ncbi:MAG: hypothetical protein ACR2FU_23705 [Streptosporangiaceae bacterium]